MATDQDAIATLIYTYAERLDAGNLDGVAALFTHATLRSNLRPDVRRGSAEALETFRSSVALYDGSPCTKHVTTNVIIDVDTHQGTAAARSYFTVLQARPELALQVVIAGRYHDQFSRTDGLWHFTDRMILVDLVGDLRFHLKRPMRRET
ncbi:MAG TPA: nuclear transport factor 2 family protein [Candidatus Margulisiibacteriota bacterium]|nr:nuclear transport factor 2 family protein [Candidatus Margulisiibacteriota bacterium]